jgi:hypothetical protein
MIALLYAAGRLLVFYILGWASLAGDKGLSTRFGDPGDRWAGAHLSCTHEKMKPGDLVCAHRTLPCGTVVMLHNPRTKRYAVCEVADRGPFGAILPSGQWGVKIKKSQPGKWRGIIDLSPAVAKQLQHNGREKVVIVHQRVAKRLRVGHTPHGRAGGR